MRRSFYFAAQAPGSDDHGRAPETGRSLLLRLREHRAARPVAIGAAVAGSVAALATASPVTAMLDPSASSAPTTEAPGTSPPSTAAPELQPQQAHQESVRLLSARQTLVRLDQKIQAVDREVHAAAGMPRPEETLSRLGAQTRAIAQSIAELTRTEENLRTLLTVDQPDQVRTTLAQAEDLLHKARLLEQHHNTKSVEARDSIAGAQRTRELHEQQQKQLESSRCGG